MVLVVYSTVSKLAYLVGQRFYGGVHYVWCAPALPSDIIIGANPPSSAPLRIYAALQEDVRSGDLHSGEIARNRAGIIRGATARAASGLIGTTEKDVIEEMAVSATTEHFQPLLLVIPWQGVETIARRVPPSECANATSEEYIISDLPRDRFDVLQLAGVA